MSSPKLEARIMVYVPQKKRKAIKKAYIDENGYWIELNEGWEAVRKGKGVRVINEKNITKLRFQISAIQREDKPSKRLKEFRNGDYYGSSNKKES